MRSFVMSGIRQFCTGHRLSSTFRQFNVASSRRLLSTVADPNEITKEDIVISEKCAEKLRRVADDGEFLRVEVEGGGCSGFQYKFRLDNQLDKSEDKVFENSGAKVVIDQTSLELLKGATIDYKEELIRSSFVVAKNPLAEHGCSCGASFTVKL